MKKIKEQQEEIIELFEMLGDDWSEKYKYIIELGQKAPSLPEEYKTDDLKIKGCQSNVWLHTYLNDDNKLIFEGDSDAMITKGLISLLIKVLSGHNPKEILEENIDFIDKIGMREHLSPNRANGLASMLKQMKLYALGYNAKLEKKN